MRAVSMNLKNKKLLNMKKLKSIITKQRMSVLMIKASLEKYLKKIERSMMKIKCFLKIHNKSTILLKVKIRKQILIIRIIQITKGKS